MAGNVWEWVSDFYADDYYSTSPIDNPPGPTQGEYKVVRSSSFISGEQDARASFRYFQKPNFNSNQIGFRCALSSGDVVSASPTKAIQELQTATATPRDPLPSPTITITSTVNPELTLILSEDFEDGTANSFSIINGFWKVVDDETGKKVFEVQRVPSSTSNWSYVEFGPVGFHSGIVEYRVRLMDYDEHEKDAGKTSFMLRHQHWGDQDYTFIMSPYYNNATIAYEEGYIGGEWISLGSKNYIFKKDTWYHIRFEAEDQKMRAYLDGNLLIEATDMRIDKPGLLAFITKAGAQFDDVKVWMPQ